MAWSKKVMKYLDKTINLIFLNTLWIAGTLLGLGILGVFPATYALFILIKDEAVSEDYVSYLNVAKQFFKNYKKGFIKMNALGLIYFSTFYFFWIDMQIVRQMGEVGNFIYILLLCFLVYTSLTLSYAFPIIIHSLGSVKQKAKLIICSPLLMPIQSICSLIFLILVLVFGYQWSVLLPLCLAAGYITLLEKWISHELIAKGLIIQTEVSSDA